MCLQSLNIKAMRLPEFSAFRLSRYFYIVRLSTVETGPKENRGFEQPKVSRNILKILPKILSKILPKIKFEIPVYDAYKTDVAYLTLDCGCT